MKYYAPVVLFAYKRKDKLEKCIEHLEKNPLCFQTDLVIYADGPKGDTDYQAVSDTQNFIQGYVYKSKFLHVKAIYSDKNKGLANSIIDGVSRVINEYGKAIVVEDDLLVSEDFLDYMNGALDYYDNYPEYGSISAYSYPLKCLKHYDKDVYAMRKGECWGWATWKDRWEKVDWTVSDFPRYLSDKRTRHEFDSLEIGLDAMLCNQMAGKIDSWAVRWCYYLFKNHLWTIFPVKSKSTNVGFDGTGVHCSDDLKKYDTKLENSMESVFERVTPYEKAEKESRFYPATRRSKLRYWLRCY